jgi:hypothetical protein
MDGRRNAYVFGKKTEGKRVLERRSCKWEDNIKMNFK